MLPWVLRQRSLLQALHFLVDLAKVRGSQEQPLWHTDVDAAMAVSAAGSYLINLLQLRVAHLSPLAITAPEAFLQACSGTSFSCPSSRSAHPFQQLVSSAMALTSHPHLHPHPSL